MWDNGNLPKKLSWNIFVLLPKVNMNTRGISLLEVLWKVVEAIINSRVNTAVQFHDILHGFCVRKGTGMNIMELKTAYDMGNIYGDLLFTAFLELKNTWNTLYCRRLL